MANNAANVSVGKPNAAGGIYSGEPTATLPIDATTALGSDFDGLGFVSEDGLTNGIEVDSENIVEWGGNTVLTIKTSRSETFAWTFIETNALVLAEVYGPENVILGAADALTVIHNASDLPRRAYVFEILMTGGKVKRIVVPNGQITEIGDVVYVAGEAIGYEVTLSCFPDEDGNTVYEYIAAIVSGE
ncbi:MAG: phage tail protein [Leucobacter sp.]